jgi:hypothetical protein
VIVAPEHAASPSQTTRHSQPLGHTSSAASHAEAAVQSIVHVVPSQSPVHSDGQASLRGGRLSPHASDPESDDVDSLPPLLAAPDELEPGSLVAAVELVLLVDGPAVVDSAVPDELPPVDAAVKSGSISRQPAMASTTTTHRVLARHPTRATSPW